MTKSQNFWNNKKVVVTGGNGFLGRYVIAKLKTLKPQSISVPRSKEFDLRDPNNCREAVLGADIVIHLAANVGGIGYNQKFPATLFYDNLLMGVFMMEEARKAGVQKFVALGTICAYPKYTPVPFRESDLWNGYPEETNAPYGLAKKMLLVQSQAYRQQYGFNAIYLLPVNLYGPGDNTDLNNSHVIPALIRKIEDARIRMLPSVEVWGTGMATREFLYAADAAEAILLATEKYDNPEPVNIGAGFEIAIRDLAEKIKLLTGYKGRIIFDKSKPDGQPRRMLDTTRAFQEFGFQASTTLEEGLKQTIEWYRNTVTKEKQNNKKKPQPKLSVRPSRRNLPNAV
jgi:GDP-L-fucose synthase